MNSLGRKLLLRLVLDNGFISLNLLLGTVLSYLCVIVANFIQYIKIYLSFFYLRKLCIVVEYFQVQIAHWQPYTNNVALLSGASTNRTAADN